MLASKDNMETRYQSQKRGIIQSNIYRNLSNVNQVIYTIDTFCVPNSSNGSPDILLIRFHRFTKFEIRKIAVYFLWLSLPGDYRVTDEALLAETT